MTGDYNFSLEVQEYPFRRKYEHCAICHWTPFSSCVCLVRVLNIQSSCLKILWYGWSMFPYENFPWTGILTPCVHCIPLGNPVPCLSFFRSRSLSMLGCVRVQGCVYSVPLSGFKMPTSLRLVFGSPAQGSLRPLALLLASLALPVQNNAAGKNSGLEPDCLALKSSSATS